MDIDVDALLEPVSEDAPAGADSSNDKERYLIESVFEQSVSIDPTASGGSDERVDWNGTVKLITKGLTQSKDIWLAIYLCRAGGLWGRLEVVEAGVLVLEGLFERYWDTLYPELDSSPSERYLERINACNSLAIRRNFLQPLETIKVLSDDRLGQFSAVDIEDIARNGVNGRNYGFFQELLKTKGPAGIDESLKRFSVIQAAFGRIDALFREKAGQTPNFTPIRDLLTKMINGLKPFATAEAAPAPAAAETASSGVVDSAPVAVAAAVFTPATGSPMSLPSSANSRVDVVKMLDLICDYYDRSEPSSPVPILLKRARAWVDMPFLDLLKDIAPGGLADAGKLLTMESKDKA